MLNIYNKNKKDVFDIFIFGSFVKKKEDFKDIDVAVVFLSSVKSSILSQIERLDKKIHTQYLKLDELYNQALWGTLFREGVSVREGKKLSDVLGLKCFGLYTYHLKSLGKRKSRFSQVLMGYKSDSMLKEVKGEILWPGVILVPIENVEYFRKFLEVWKAKYRLKYIYVE